MTSNEERGRWGPILRWVERVVLAGLIVFAAYRLGPQLGAWVGVGPDLGKAPVYTLTTLDGETISSEDLLGDVVILNFWATWCPPCRLEMPSLQALHEDMAADGVTVLGLATDVGSGQAVREFVAERELTYAIGRATYDQRRSFGGIRGIPTTFVIDRQGIIRHRVVGYFAPPALRAATRRLIEEEVVSPPRASLLPSPAPVP